MLQNKVALGWAAIQLLENYQRLGVVAIPRGTGTIGERVANGDAPRPSMLPLESPKDRPPLSPGAVQPPAQAPLPPVSLEPSGPLPRSATFFRSRRLTRFGVDPPESPK